MRLPLLVLVLVGLAACVSARALRQEERDIVIWYIEDTAHGSLRQAGEIQLQDASGAMAQVARLLVGSVQGGSVIPPRLLDARQRRWPALRSLFRSGLAVVIAQGRHRGLVAPRKGLAAADLALASGLVDAENDDRRTLDALVISTAQLDGARREAYREAAASVRCELDAAAGGTPWLGEAGP